MPETTPISRALNSIIQDGRFTVPEMAEVAECSDRHIYQVRNGKADLNATRFAKLSRWLCRNGEPRLARTTICTEYKISKRMPGVSNGCLKDETIAIVEAAADARRAHNDRCAPSMEECIEAIERALADARAELDRIKD